MQFRSVASLDRTHMKLRSDASRVVSRALFPSWILCNDAMTELLSALNMLESQLAGGAAPWLGEIRKLSEKRRTA